MTYVLSMRTQERGGPVVPARLESGPSLGTSDELVLESRLTIVVHGYNVSRSAGRQSLSRFADMIADDAGGGILAVLWPGDHWSRALSYSWEGRDADDSAAALVRFIEDHVATSVALSFVAHSLGNRVALEAVERLVDRGYDVGQLCLLAAAIDAYSLASPEDYLAGVGVSKRTAVLWSKKDKVLRFAYPAGDLLQAFLFSGNDSRGFALGYRGPRRHAESDSNVPANVIDIRIPNTRKADHGDYLPSADPAEAPNDEQRSAAAFVKAVLSDDPRPGYV